MSNTARTPKSTSSNKTLMDALERRYALLKGRHETIEQECEMVEGVAALLAEQDRVESEKILMGRVLAAMEVVMRHVKPDWCASQVNPIYPKRRDSSTGRIATTGYQILRRERRPMQPREIAHMALAAHGIEVDWKTAMRFDVAIRGALDRRVGKEIGVEPGPPKRYFILERA